MSESRLRMCPDCNREMTKHVEMRDGIAVELDRCIRCGGIWLDSGEMEALQEAEVRLYLAAAAGIIKQQAELRRAEEETKKLPPVT